MYFADMIKLRISGWGYYPGLSRWVLNAITCTSKRKTGSSDIEKGKQCDHDGKDWNDATKSLE